MRMKAADTPRIYQTVAESKSAWLITWRYFRDEMRDQPETVVAIFDSRTRPDYVLRRVEQLYVNSLSLAQQLAYADDRNALRSFEQARFVYGEYRDEIWCGLSPTLYARKVENLRVEADQFGAETLAWDELDHESARRELRAKNRLETDERDPEPAQHDTAESD